VCGLLSDEHFAVDGTQVAAWASMKSFRAKDGSDEPPSGGHSENVISTWRLAGLPCGDAIDGHGAVLDLGQPLPSARDGGDELDPSVGTMSLPQLRGNAPESRLAEAARTSEHRF
jgi:hypothetical protein